jgi:DNA-directed RNA polymerase alpha subunit
MTEFEELTALVAKKIREGSLTEDQLAKLVKGLKKCLREPDHVRVKKQPKTPLEKVHKQLEDAKALTERSDFLKSRPDAFDLSLRSSLRLEEAGVEKIGWLAGLTQKQFERIGLRQKLQRELKTIFASHGFKLGNSLEEFSTPD